MRALKPWQRSAVLLALAAVVMSILEWQFIRDPEINFLPRHSGAQWVLFPAAVDPRLHRIATLDTVFRRTFTLDNQPRRAQLALYAAKRIELKINGRVVDVGAIRNWKNISIIDALDFLRPGTNTIEARVFNDNAPPALWLALSADKLTLRSDQTWEGSTAGSAWRSVALASTPRIPGAGNLIGGGEKTFSVLTKIWPIWMAFAAVAFVVCAAAIWRSGRWKRPVVDPGGLSRIQATALVLMLAGLWLILFSNNAAKLPFHAGFDSQDHLNYIRYVQERRALPLPTEGFEMFQPPLYYVLSAVVLSTCHLTVSNESSVVILRLLTTIFGIANFTLAFLSVRLLFPNRAGAQLVGLILAAFLPMQLYLSHYVTNETLAATLVTATVYLGLRVLQTEKASMFRYLSLGLCMGAAMLAKATSFLVLPPLLGALMVQLASPRPQFATRLRYFCVMLTVFFAVCGWRYIWIWRRFGTPFLGNWNPATGFPWWQDPGYHTAADYLRFGQSLVNPLFSGFAGFADGIYSTLWGDGLGGGLSDLPSRTPWNYDLVIGGYLLALLPTLVISLGAALAIYRFVRNPSAEWFMLLGFSAAVAVGVIFMTLRVPWYAQVKAFYGLSALVPLCCFGILGYERFTAGRKSMQFALGAVLVVWALNSFASVWIRRSASQLIYAGLRLISEHKIDPSVSELAKAVDSDPSNAIARRFLAAALDEAGQSDKAIEQATKAIELDPMNSECHLQMGMTFAKQDQMERAIEEARRAIELGPENSRAYDLLFTCLRQSQRTDEAIKTARDGLAVSPSDAELHYRLGLAEGQTGDFATAANQFAYTLLLRPDRSEPVAKLRVALSLLAKMPNASEKLEQIVSLASDSPKLLNELAWLFATDADSTLRNGPEAVRLAERACNFTERNAPALLATLAAAYAETERFPEAITTIRKALSLSESSSDYATVTLCQNLLTSFQANRPYRQEPR